MSVMSPIRVTVRASSSTLRYAWFWRTSTSRRGSISSRAVARRIVPSRCTSPFLSTRPLGSVNAISVRIAYHPQLTQQRGLPVVVALFQRGDLDGDLLNAVAVRRQRGRVDLDKGVEEARARGAALRTFFGDSDVQVVGILEALSGDLPGRLDRLVADDDHAGRV